MRPDITGIATKPNHDALDLVAFIYRSKLALTKITVDEGIRPLLKLSREMIGHSQKLEYGLISSLERDPLLRERIMSSGLFREWVQSPR